MILLKIDHHHHHHLKSVAPTSHASMRRKYETSGIHAGHLDGWASQQHVRMANQPSVTATILRHPTHSVTHQAVIYPWEFEASFGDRMLLPDANPLWIGEEMLGTGNLFSGN